MKRKLIFILTCLLSTGVFAQVENDDNKVVIDWSEDSTDITTIQDIIKVQQQVTNRNVTEQHFADVWGRRGYFNFSYNTTKLSPKGNYPNGLDNGPVGELKSNWGASIQYGRSYRLHKKPISNVALFNIDYTGIDLNVNHFEAIGNGTYKYNSSIKHTEKEDGKDSKYYNLPWNMEKYEVNYGMTLGPSLTLAPFNLLSGNGLHYIKFNVFYHIGYNISMIYSPNDKKLDENQSGEDFQAMESNLKMAWGHGMMQSFGFNISWKAIGIGFEHRSSTIKYKAVNTKDFGKNEYEFSSATNRISLQIRM
jgi:hypothetical protein